MAPSGFLGLSLLLWVAPQVGAFLVPTQHLPPPSSRGLHHDALHRNIQGRQVQWSSISISTRSRSVSMKAATARGLVATRPLKQLKTGDYIRDTNELGWKTLPEIFETMAVMIPDQVAVEDPIHKPATKLTYQQLNEQITKLAAVLQSKGLKQGECVSIFSENSPRWLAIDQAILRAGGCNAVRGVRAPVGELQYIYSNSQSVALVVETPDLIAPLLQTDAGLGSDPRFIVVLYPGGRQGKEIKEKAGTSVEVVTFEELLSLGDNVTLQPVARDPEAVATLVYTSGTTNQPKGVMLKHSNILHQVFYNRFARDEEAYNARVGDVSVSVLPCWHIFERTGEYWMYSKGIHTVYSNVKNFKGDLAKFKPHFIFAVPRLFETIYRGVLNKFATEAPGKRKIIDFFTKVTMSHVQAQRTLKGLVIRDQPPSIIEKFFALLVVVALSPLRAVGDKLVWSKIRAGLGGRIKVLVSGGSSLPLVLEDFFEMIKTTVIVGYGMTETSPVITNRLAETNLAGSVGLPAKNTIVKIVDPETGAVLGPGKSGLVLMKGPQRMAGYKSNQEATDAVVDKDGFLNTGDLGRLNPGSGHLIITGRAKDTIVLSNGENIEPQPIEDQVCTQSELVDQMMCVGQDQKQIGALVVPRLGEMARRGLVDQALADEVSEIVGPQALTNGIVGDWERLKAIEVELNKDKKLRKALLEDIGRVQGASKGTQDFERVGEVYFVLEPFNMVNGFLTQTLKIKRNLVYDHYAKEIAGLYASK